MTTNAENIMIEIIQYDRNLKTFEGNSNQTTYEQREDVIGWKHVHISSDE